MIYKKFGKRLFDLLVSITLLVLSSPLFFIVIFLLLISNKGTPFFIQKRPGLNSKVFPIIKFKTMNDKRDINGELLPDIDRVTFIGNIIRKTSLDEVPQLLNVLLGDMSIIGPRPLLIEYLKMYSPSQSRRHSVKPGITGWAQVNGRNAISWSKKFELDVWYVENLSFGLDLRIILLTIKKVAARSGINSSSSVTMEKFNGYN